MHATCTDKNDMSAVPVMERMSEHVHKARMVDKIKYRMAPLLSETAAD